MKPLFRLREFAWVCVSEVEDWLYPYRSDDIEPLWAEDDDDDDKVTYLEAQMEANNERIDRLQSEMLYVSSQINDINILLGKNIRSHSEGQKAVKLLLKRAKKNPELYSKDEIRYAKKIKRRIKKGEHIEGQSED